MRASLVFALVMSLSRSLSKLMSLTANAAMVNRTIDDSDTNAISYSPSASWRSSSDASCSECLVPNAQLALQQTFHYGIYAAPPPDADDQAVGNSGNSSGGDGDSDDNGHGGSISGKSGRGDSDDDSSKKLAKWRRVDADDPNFVDVNVTASLSFVGSAFYVYCVLPVQADNATTLSKTNLTFLLDNSRVGSFSHNPQKDTGSSAGFQYQVPVFSKADLPYDQHTLVIKAEVGSIVLLDYVQYSTLESSNTDEGNSSATNPAPTPSGAIDSQENSDTHSKGNAATFGAAIGGSVGVLTLISLGVFISLFRRRRRSAKRQKFLEAREEAARPPSPEMRGPQPFIPRYFPGTTVIPRSPSPPPFSPMPNSELEELGPSHGLNLPPAPEHAGTPESARQFSERLNPIRVNVPVSPPSAVLPGDDDDTSPPRYQDVERFPPVSIPVFAHSPSPLPSPPGLPDSPSSLRSPLGGESPTSLTSLSPRRPDFSPIGMTVARVEEPTIRTHES